jgi:hypothetical protein
MTAQTNELLSQAEVSRLANIPYPRFVGLVKDGKIVPDYHNGKTLLFLPASMETIRKEFGK